MAVWRAELRRRRRLQACPPEAVRPGAEQLRQGMNPSSDQTDLCPRVSCATAGIGAAGCPIPGRHHYHTPRSAAARGVWRASCLSILSREACPTPVRSTSNAAAGGSTARDHAADPPACSSWWRRARRWPVAMTPMALLGLYETGRPLGSLRSAAFHQTPAGIPRATAVPASGLMRGSNGAARAAPPLEGLGLASKPASWALVQEIHWPAASTPRAGLGEHPPPPSSFTLWGHDSRGRRLLVRPEDERRPAAACGAPPPPAARARRRERRPASPLRCLHGSAGGKNAARQGAGCGGLVG